MYIINIYIFNIYIYEQSGIKKIYPWGNQGLLPYSSLAWLSKENLVAFSVSISEIAKAEARSSMRSLALRSAAHKHLLFNRDLALGEARFQHVA